MVKILSFIISKPLSYVYIARPISNGGFIDAACMDLPELDQQPLKLRILTCKGYFPSYICLLLRIVVQLIALSLYIPVCKD